MTQSTESPAINRELIAHDMRTQLTGKLDADLLDAAVSDVLATTSAYPANGSFVSLVFYMQVQVVVTGGKTFNGKAGGIALPGGGALFGDVYTDDINRLYSDTVSFSFQATPVYVAVQFWDSNSAVLGSFQAGAVNVSPGTGGGTGSWS